MSPVIPPWYALWVKNHLTTFAAYSPENCETFALWWFEFESFGATESELHAATRTVLGHEHQPDRISQHFAALKSAILRRRDFERTRRENQRRDEGAKPLAEVWPADFLSRVEAARR